MVISYNEGTRAKTALTSKKGKNKSRLTLKEIEITVNLLFIKVKLLIVRGLKKKRC